MYSRSSCVILLLAIYAPSEQKKVVLFFFFYFILFIEWCNLTDFHVWAFITRNVERDDFRAWILSLPIYAARMFLLSDRIQLRTFEMQISTIYRPENTENYEFLVKKMKIFFDAFSHVCSPRIDHTSNDKTTWM